MEIYVYVNLSMRFIERMYKIPHILYRVYCNYKLNSIYTTYKAVYTTVQYIRYFKYSIYSVRAVEYSIYCIQ